MKLVLQKNLLELLFPKRKHITYKRMRKKWHWLQTHTHKLKSRIGKDMPSKNSGKTISNLEFYTQRNC